MAVIWIVFAEPVNIANVRTLKAVNCLVVIANRHNIWRVACRVISEIKQNTQLC